MASKVLQHRVIDVDAENVEPSDSIVGLHPNKRSLPAGSKLRCAPPSKRAALQKLENVKSTSLSFSYCKIEHEIAFFAG